MRETTTSDRLAILDGLRGLAILLVVWYHLWLVTGYVVPGSGPLQLFAEAGFLGVDLFFFISGFCISYPYAKARAAGRPRPSLAEFVRRRARKIGPSYLVALIAFACIYHAHFTSVADEATTLVAHLSFVHVWFPQTFGSLSGPLWTLGVEVQFYVLFAFAIPLAERKPLALYAAFLAIAIVYRGILVHAGADNDFTLINQLPAVLDVFGAGMLAAFAVVTVNARGLELDRRACSLGAIVVACVDASDLGRASGSDPVHRWLNAWRVCFGPILFVATLGIALGTKHLRAIAGAGGVLAFLSLVSYNLYLWNLETAVWLQSLGRPAWQTFWVGAAVSVGVAWLLTACFERPIVKHGPRGYGVRALAYVRRGLDTVAPGLLRRFERPNDAANGELSAPGGNRTPIFEFRRLVPYPLDHGRAADD